MNDISFSICIPNYNYAHYIYLTIQSVLNQSHQNFEIVVVDNASTDNSIEVVESFGDPRIRLFRNSYNVGFAPNLDRAASRVLNSYIIMLSSDDLMRPNALAEYAQVLKTLGEHAEDILLVSSVDVINEHGVVIDRRDRRTHYQIEPSHPFQRFFQDPAIEVFSGLSVFKATYPRMSVPGHFCTTLFSRKLYDLVGGYGSIHPIGPDAHLSYKIMLRDAPVVFINRPLFAYRVHMSNQSTQSRNAKNLKVPINTYLFSIEYKDSDLERANITRVEITRCLVDDTCLKGGMAELRLGSPYQAFRYLMFALASAPGMTLRNPKTYGLALLLCLGPLAPAFSRLLYKMYKALIPGQSAYRTTNP